MFVLWASTCLLGGGELSTLLDQVQGTSNTWPIEVYWPCSWLCSRCGASGAARLSRQGCAGRICVEPYCPPEMGKTYKFVMLYPRSKTAAAHKPRLTVLKTRQWSAIAAPTKHSVGSMNEKTATNEWLKYPSTKLLEFNNQTRNKNQIYQLTTITAMCVSFPPSFVPPLSSFYRQSVHSRKHAA